MVSKIEKIERAAGTRVVSRVNRLTHIDPTTRRRILLYGIAIQALRNASPTRMERIQTRRARLVAQLKPTFDTDLAVRATLVNIALHR